MPTEKELRLLAKIVCAKYPDFGDVSGQGFYGSKEDREEDWFKQFKAAFKAIGAFKRLDEPNHKVYLSWHMSAVENHLRSIRCFENLRVGPLLCAALAHGDIKFRLGKYPELGLNEHVGVEASDKWKRVLSGSLLPESPGAQRIHEQTSPVRIIGQGYNG